MAVTLNGSELCSFVEHAPVAIAMFDREMRCIAASKRWLSERNVDASISRRLAYDEYLGVDASLRSMHLRALAGELTSLDEDHSDVTRKVIKLVRRHMHPWRGLDGQIGGSVIFEEDITATKSSQETMLKTEERYRYAVEASSDGIWDWDLKNNTVNHSPAYYRMLGYEASDWDEGSIRLWTDLLPPEDRERVVATTRELLESRGHYQVEFRLRAKDNTYRWILSRARVVQKDKSGFPIRAVGTHTDITALKRAEEKARKFAEHLSLAQSVAHVGTFEWDLKVNRTTIDGEYCAVLGLPPGTPLTYTGLLLIGHPEGCADAQKFGFEAGGRFEKECRISRSSDGAVCWIIWKGKLFLDEEGRPERILGAVWDITERKRVEEVGRKTTERLELAQTAGKIGLWEREIATGEGVVNDQFNEIFGLPRDSKIPYEEFLLCVHPEDRPRIVAANFEALQAKSDIDYVYRIKRASDGESRWVCARAGHRLGADGQPISLAGAVWDITERKQAEETLRESDRRKDEFLATLGHELRTPLATIQLATDVIEADADTAKKFGALLSRMQRQVRHLTRMVNDVLEVSRISKGKISLQIEQFDLKDFLDQLEDSLRAKFEEKSIVLHFDVHERVLINGDPIRLTQVFANILDNAVKFTDRGGNVVLTASAEGNEAVVRIRDTGVGISPGLLTGVFDLFSQIRNGSDRTLDGIGVGLALARKLIELHGGAIAAKSEGLGKGSEFIVRIPVAR
jgi:PAS domain S-box-containing protein